MIIGKEPHQQIIPSVALRKTLALDKSDSNSENADSSK